MKAYTNYPFTFLGDKRGEPAPLRECEVHSYDGDKYCEITVSGIRTSVKIYYLYKLGTLFRVPENLLYAQLTAKDFIGEL